MPTLEDLHAAFAELERQAPDELSRPVPPPHRRRWVAVGLAAACTAAVAIAVPLAVDNSHGRTPPQTAPTTLPHVLPTGHFRAALPAPAAGHSPELAYGFVVPGQPAGYTVIPDLITRTYQHATVYGPTDPPGGQIFVFYRGAFDPATLTNRIGTSVDGRAGYYADTDLPGSSGAVQVLAWQYASGGWALVRLGVDQGNPAAKGGSERADEERAAQSQAVSALVAHNELVLARAMEPAHRTLHSPVRVPAGSRLSVRSISADAGPDGSIVLTGPGGTSYTLGWSPDRLHAADKPGTTTTHVGGHDWIVYSDGSYGLVAQRFGLTVVADTTSGIASAAGFVRTLTIASTPAHTDTWFDAGSALP